MTAIVHEWPEINRANLWPRVCAWLVVLIGILLLPGTANAYGAMTHALVAFKSRDATIKFLQTTTKNQQGLNSSEQNSVVLDSIAGALLHDVGYIYPPYLSYSNLWHYHATGGFVEYLGFRAGKLDVRTDRLNALAFALGAVNHYTSDQIGHFEVTNRASATVLNKQKEVGERLAYEDNEKQHMCIESALDKIALRELSTSELGEFLLALKQLAALVKKREYPRQGIFDLVSEALTKVYGLEAKVLQNLGADAFLYANLRDAYLVMLVYLRSVIESSNLDYRFDKDYFNDWPSSADIREIKNKVTTLLSCDPNFNEVKAFVDKCA